jgi:hypothetical protein
MAVNTDRRLQKPCQRQRSDVLGSCGLQAAHGLAEVIGIATLGQPGRGSHVALLEVTQVGAEDERLDEALPEVAEQYRHTRDDQEDRPKTAILER